MEAAMTNGRIYLREGKRGPVWYGRWRDSTGTQHNRSLGRAWRRKSSAPDGYMTKRAAERRLTHLADELEAGRALSRRVGHVNFGQAARSWLAYVEHDRKRAASTVRDYRIAVERVFLPAFGEDTPLHRLDADGFERWRVEQVRNGVRSDRTINKYLVLLHAIFKRAQKLYGLPENPLALVERQPVRRSNRIDFLAMKQVEALIRAAASAQDAALYATAAMTGLRWGELEQLRWNDIEFAKRLVHVRHRTKSHLVRSVPAATRVLGLLDGLSRRSHWTAPNDPVFVNELGGPLDHSKQTKRYRRALEEAGLRKLRFHDLRHTFGTHAVRVAPLTDVKAWMGHADISTTMVYVHHVPQHDAADRLDRAFLVGDAGLCGLQQAA
jgi:integrase